MYRKAWHRRSGFHRSLGVLAILALAMRALIPTGYMVAPVDGRAQLVICPAGLHLHQAAHLHHTAGAAGTAHEAATAHGGMGHTSELCPFALAGGPGLTGAAPAPVQPYFVLLSQPRIVAFAGVTQSPPFRHQAPRGPPALV